MTIAAGVRIKPLSNMSGWTRLKSNRNWLGLWFMLPAAGFLAARNWQIPAEHHVAAYAIDASGNELGRIDFDVSDQAAADAGSTALAGPTAWQRHRHKKTSVRLQGERRSVAEVRLRNAVCTGHHALRASLALTGRCSCCAVKRKRHRWPSGSAGGRS